MCYDVSSGLRASIKYAKHRHDDPQKIAALEQQLEAWRITEHQHFHLNGFQHPSLMVFTNDSPDIPNFFKWGLIPSWCKDEKAAALLSNQTLNARAETIFEKPAFRESAKSRRCIIMIDGFFEYHHHKGKNYPYYISMKEDIPIAMAGLWDVWTNKSTGELIHTVSIITTRANNLMKRIHNNPALAEPRMPAMLTRENQELWLQELSSTKDINALQQLLLPFPEEKMQSWTVGKLKGKDAVGDNERAIQPKAYEALQIDLALFKDEN